MSDSFAPGERGVDEIDRLLQIGELLLNGWGFNWYRADNRMRADDLLVRNHGDELLGSATAHVRAAEAAFRHDFLPPPSRERPFADPVRLAELRMMQSAIARLGDLRTRLRGAAAPPDDKIWRRYRAQEPMLAALVRADVEIAGACGELAREAAALPPATVSQRLEPLLGMLGAALDRRAAGLAVGV